MRGITLVLCSVLLAACDNGSSPGPSGVGGEGGMGGEGGEGGQGGGGEGGDGQLANEACDHVTRCSTEGAVCRDNVAAVGYHCEMNQVPVGEPCEDDEECGGLELRGDCGRPTAGAPKVCLILCQTDTNCLAGMVCDFQTCVPEPLP